MPNANFYPSLYYIFPKFLQAHSQVCNPRPLYHLHFQVSTISQDRYPYVKVIAKYAFRIEIGYVDAKVSRLSYGW